ncbi:MAG: leucine-rich repeat domain-containing protein [Gammaproteobacteria bacterium]|nr:leucine-rich repeat domain-containing protein [Gammaproteobacteria bacterium]
MAAASDPLHQGFVRVVSRSSEAGEVTIEPVDDSGTRYGPITLALAPGQTMHFNSDDLEYGNADKGLSGGVGPGEGQWRLELSSDLDFDVLSYMRHRGDGYLTSLHDLVPQVDGVYYVAFLNPGSNAAQVGMLRLTNPGSDATEVEITGLDDRGETPGTAVTLTLEARASRTVTAAELESGSADGLSGALGDGAGKWRLHVRADGPVRVMSLLRSPTGHLSNLSSVPEPTVTGDLTAYRVLWFPSGGLAEQGNQGFVRVINHSQREGTVEIRVFWPRVATFWGRPAGWPWGTTNTGWRSVELSIGANSVAHFNSQDLAAGNSDKGLPNGVGWGGSLLQLRLRSELDIEVLSYLRTKDGFVTSVHDPVPRAGDVHHVAFLNPGSNQAQRSVIALFNSRADEAVVRIDAVDDHGASPGSPIEFEMDEKEALLLAVPDLEVGRRPGAFSPGHWAYRLVSGALGDGVGKWRLRVESDRPIQVMSLLLSPTGHVTNLSSAPGAVLPDPEVPLPPNPAIGSEAVHIPDSHLRRMVAAALGKTEGSPISPAEMARLKVLDQASSYPWVVSEDEDDRLYVDDLAGLEAAVNLEGLYLASTGEEDLTPLAGLTNLRALHFDGSDIADLAPLAGLTNLRALGLPDSFVTDISALAGLANLEVLDLDYNGITDLRPLAGLTELRVLQLRGCGEYPIMCALPPLAGLTRLEKLVITGDLAHLSGLPNLRTLEVDGNVLDLNITALGQMPRLRVLRGGGAGDDLSPLIRLTGLTVLELQGVSATLAPLSRLPGLLELQIEGGEVEDISVLSAMTGLAKVFLADNRIANLAPLVANAGLGEHDLVHLRGNPLTDESLNQHIPALRARGVIVTLTQ